MFWVAGRALRLPASRRSTGVPVYHPDVRVWEVKDADGRARRPLVLRPLRAPGQALGRVDERVPRPGALRRRGHDDRLEQRELREGQAGRAGPHQLGRRDDAVPRVRPRAARPLLERQLPVARRAPRVARDYVEFPSQLLEHWLVDARGPQPLRAALPDRASRSRRSWSQKIERAATFNQGFATVEYLASALVDMKLHLAGDERDRPRRVRARDARRARHADGDRDAPPHAAVQPHLRGRRLLGRLLQLPLGGHADRRRLGGVHRGGRAVRQGGGEAPCAKTSSRSATRSIRPTATARSAAATPGSTR